MIKFQIFNKCLLSTYYVYQDLIYYMDQILYYGWIKYTFHQTCRESHTMPPTHLLLLIFRFQRII